MIESMLLNHLGYLFISSVDLSHEFVKASKVWNIHLAQFYVKKL